MTTIRLFPALPPFRQLCLTAQSMMLLAAAFINVANALDASGDPPFPTPVATCDPQRHLYCRQSLRSWSGKRDFRPTSIREIGGVLRPEAVG